MDTTSRQIRFTSLMATSGMDVTCAFSSDSEGGKHFEVLRKRRENTIARHKKIRNAGFNLIAMRECIFLKEMKENPEVDMLLVE